MHRLDWLDWLVFTVLAILLLVVVPAFVGRAMSPYDPDSGRPVLLTANIIAERRYLDEVARPALALASEADKALEDASHQMSRGVILYQQANRLRDLLDRLSVVAEKMESSSPPARFASLHNRILDVVVLYQTLTQEALAYFGDVDTDHLSRVQQGLDQGRPVLEMLFRVVEQVSLPIGPIGPAGPGRIKPAPEHDGLEELDG